MNNLCIECCTKPTSQDSHYCSSACESAYMAEVDGPIRCDGCSLELDTISEAVATGWTGIEADPEGLTCNFGGLCPACKAEEDE